MKKAKGWVKKHKKLVIFLCVALLIAAGIIIVSSRAKRAMAQLAELSEETATVERRSIQSSVSSTGTIISDSTRSLTASLTGLEVLSVNVEVGDVVAVGDPICSFDTSDIEDNLADAEKSLSAAKTQTNVSVNNARRALEQAVETQNYQIESAARNIISAGEAYSSACDAYDRAKSRASEAYTEMQDARRTLDSIPANLEGSTEYAKYISAKNAYDIALAAYNSYIVTDESDTAQTEKRTELFKASEEAAKALTAAETALNALDLDKRRSEAEYAYSAAKSTYESLDSSLSSLESSVRSARTAYENAQASYEYTVASQQSQYDGSVDGLKSAKASAGVATQQQENAVDTYQEQLEKGTLKASIAGTITAVNVKEGDTYAGGVIATIQDCSDFVVSAEIDEYDIADVELGMKAIFKTDATRDEQLEGEVIFVSPTPTQGSDVTYQVKVRINSDTGRLRLGMNAKLNIILSETENVLTVPYDAVQQDENGNDVVYVITRTETGGTTRTAVPVTVGAEGDYYVEVNGDIKEGDEVAMPSDETFDFSQMMMMGG